MRIKNINFKEIPKLLINGVEFNFDPNSIVVKEHLSNNAGTSLKVNRIFPLGYSEQDIINKPFKLDKYSRVEVFFGDQLFFKGFVKKQSQGTLNPFLPKYINIVAVTLKEFLTKKPMNFPIIDNTYNEVIDKVVNKLDTNIIVKGETSFTSNTNIKAYSTQNKNALDVLKLVQKHSNSMLITKLTDGGQLSLNFYDEKSLLNGHENNRGIDIDFETEAKQKAFFNNYQITNFEWSEFNRKEANSVYVESEKVIVNLPRTIEVDLQNAGEDITLQFPVGRIDRRSTIIVDEVNNTTKRVVIASSQQNKPADLTYTPNSNSINLNPRILGNNEKLVIVFYPIIRNGITQEDPDHQDIISQYTDTDGKLFTYEKHNDLTETADLFEMAKRRIAEGVANKVELKISSIEPIWDIGEYTIFTGDENYNYLNGGYIIREAEVRMMGVYTNGVSHKVFNYTLIKSVDTDNAYNFNDSLASRDNPIYADETTIIDVTETFTQNIYLVALNWEETSGLKTFTEGIGAAIEQAIETQENQDDGFNRLEV